MDCTFCVTEDDFDVISFEAEVLLCERLAGEGRATALPFTLYRRPDMYRSRTVDIYWSAGGGVVKG
ncbi:MAG: hypothetical protein ABGY71_13100 [bacterium]|jgi:hypothetical protein|nr:hypothetical protein [Planctomycetota bacterium]HIL51252.1 hypothetical protein [Planctomycetota bacterium]